MLMVVGACGARQGYVTGGHTATLSAQTLQARQSCRIPQLAAPITCRPSSCHLQGELCVCTSTIGFLLERQRQS